MNKTAHPRAWLFVLPVVLLVAFNALIPLMTVVNYSVQETFGDNVFFWEGMKWFEQVLRSERFHESFRDGPTAARLPVSACATIPANGDSMAG